jgi:hypothetical protein
MREGSERREVKSVDFYLVALISLVPLVLPHHPCRTRLPPCAAKWVRAPFHLQNVYCGGRFTSSFAQSPFATMSWLAEPFLVG